MNKTININLGGFFFHIDEDAYKKLKIYLSSIANSLSDDPQGKNEIIADIEARISELLSEKITDARQVVNQGDIDEIIKIMGQPEDYADTERTDSHSSYSYDRNYASGKKLFRDGNDKFLGGVASGIGHYFNMDVIWIRLGFLALLVGAGTGVLLYIILWILLPEAKTTAEKLQMEGEPVNINNIERKIRDEFNSVSDKVKNAAENVSEKIKYGANDLSEKFSKTDFKGKGSNVKSRLQDFLDALGKIILVLFQVIGKFIGVFLIMLSSVVLIALFAVTLAGLSSGNLDVFDINGTIFEVPLVFFETSLPIWVLYLSSFLLVGIPFLLLFILGLRILSSRVKKFGKATSLALFGVWIIALFTLGFSAFEFGSSHKKTGKYIQKNPINIIQNDTLFLKVKNDETIYYQHSLKRDNEKYKVEINGVTQIYSNEIFINVKKSETNEAYLLVEKKSRGANRNKASKNAKEIKYQFIQKDKEIILDAFFLSKGINLWKEENVTMTLYIPENNTVYFDKSTSGFLSNVENTTNTYDGDMANHYFTMTEKGLYSEELTSLKDEE